MAASPSKAMEPENSGGQPMGANSTQATGIVFLLIGFVLLAGAFAGGGALLAIGAVVFLGVSCFFFLKAKPWEHREQ